MMEKKMPGIPHTIRGTFMPTKNAIDPTPNWSKWKHMKNASLWEAVALALNINPELPLMKESNWGYPSPAKDAPNDFKDLFDISDNRKFEFCRGNTYLADLEKFGTFIESLGDSWALPPEFPRAKPGPAPVEQAPQGVTVQPTAPEDQPPYMTSKLRALFKTMQEVEKTPAENAVSVIRQVTGLPERDAKLIAALINPKPDGRAKPWKNE